MGIGTTLTPSDIFKAQESAAATIHDYPEAVMYVLAHNCHEHITRRESSPIAGLLNQMMEERQGEATPSNPWVQMERGAFSKVDEKNNLTFQEKCKLTAVKIKHDNGCMDDYVLPPGQVEPGLVKTLGMVSCLELKLIRTFSQLNPNDTVYLLEHPQVIEDLASGRIPLEAEGIQAEVEEMEDVIIRHKLNNEDPDYRCRDAIMRAHEAFEHVHMTMASVTEKEIKEHKAHPSDTVVNPYNPLYQVQHDNTGHVLTESDGTE